MTNDKSIPLPILDAALSYRDAGMSVVATRADKKPVAAWTPYQSEYATDEQLGDMFMNTNIATSVGIICGAVSGNLECLDFDDGGAAWEEWSRVIEEDHPGLLSRLVMEQTPRGGRHLLYRVPGITLPVGQKLAQRPGEKSPVCVIETRGEKQYFCAFPSPGYSMLQGDLRGIPAVTPAEREAMHRLAMAFDQMPVSENRMHRPGTAASNVDARHGRPGDDFNRRGDMRGILQRHGWTYVRTIGHNEQWRRPGKDKGISATLRNINGVDIFFVFSSSTLFEAMRGFTPFQVAAMLEHNGDHSSAARSLRAAGYGEAMHATAGEGDDIPEWDEPDDIESDPDDPGAFPLHLLNTPPHLREIYDFILAEAIRPQPLFALGASIAVAGAALGRRVETPTGLRTNFYILVIGPSRCGKDSPRYSIKNIFETAMKESLGAEDFASDTGLLRALQDEPAQLFPIDEFGRFLKELASPKAGSHLAGISTVLLKLYSSANSVFKSKAYADTSRNFTLQQPHAVLFGTSVMKSVYESLTVDSISDGFLARMLIFETETPNVEEQTPVRGDVPESIIETMNMWKALGNKYQLSEAMWIDAPTVTRIEASPGATEIFARLSKRAAGIRDQLGDNPLEALWNRVGEHAMKLALIHACADSPTSPYIGEASATWGVELAEWLIAKTAYRATGRIAENQFHGKTQRCLQIIREAGMNGVSKSRLYRRMKCPTSELNQILEALDGANLISEKIVKTKGRRGGHLCSVCPPPKKQFLRDGV